MRQPIYILMLLLLSATSGFGVYAAEDPLPKYVRVLFGYENIGRWEQLLTESIAEVFLNDGRVIFQTEYLPLNAQDPASLDMYSTLERARLNEPDVMVAVRSQASSFVNQWRDRFYADIPRLYVLPGTELETAVLESETDVIVPSAGDTAARETLELLPQLLPNLEHIYIVLGDGAADADYLVRIQNVIQETDLQQTIHYLVGLTPSEVSAELNAAPQNTAALFSSYTTDRTGQLFRAGDVVRIVSAQSDTPLFGIFDDMLNTGIVGGSMTSAALYGKKAAEMVLTLLFDDTLPANLETATGYFFDATQLDRFGIDRNLLPEGSEIINDNPSLLQQYRWQFTLGGIVLLILLFLIAALGKSLRRRNKAEKALIKANKTAVAQAQQLFAVIDNVIDGIITISKDGTIESFSRAAVRIFGYREEEVLGQNVKMLMPEPYRDEHDGYLGAFHATDVKKVIGIGRDVRGRHKDGSTFPMYLGVSDVVFDNVHKYVGIVRDTSERDSTYEQLRQAQKMEAVGQLTGGIAHDFNNILAIIMGNLELAQLEASGHKNILSSINRALEGASRGTALIDNLLGFSRVHTSEMTLTSLNQSVESMSDLLVKSLTASIEVETELDANLWSVNVDVGDLEGAILNLALNARDAMPDGGRLSIETANKVIDADFLRSQPEARLGEYAMLSVSDTGIGMLPEIREKILEPFFTTKSEGQGTGLGLSMVYGFVKRSDGFITVVSEPGAGTSIKLFLPRERREALRDTLTTDNEELPRGDETVLVVDDEEELVKLAVANLESLGYTVLTALDGESALALIKDKPNIDLLFSDVVMPGELDGYLLSVAANKANPALKILLTSGFTKRNKDYSSADRPMFEELTRNLLRKPYNQAELAKAVRNVLD